MKSMFAFAVVLVLAVAGCSTAPSVRVSPFKMAPGQQVPQVSVAAHPARPPAPESLNYLLYLPKDYDQDTTRRWPIVLFLHGAGERGTNIDKVTVHGPPKLVKAGRDFPFILVSPQCPEGTRWNADRLMALMDELGGRLRVDPARWYVTGLSMGGFGSWDLATMYPDRWAAAAPVCGGGRTIDVLLKNKPEVKTIGVWAFHGGKDNVVLPDESERMVSTFKRAGNADVRLTVYPEAGHDSWTAAYNDGALYDWLLQHHR